MSSDWRVQLCCRACGLAIELPLGALGGLAAAPCPDPSCDGDAALPADLVETARFMFEESRRRVAANDHDHVAPSPAEL